MSAAQLNAELSRAEAVLSEIEGREQQLSRERDALVGFNATPTPFGPSNSWLTPEKAAEIRERLTAVRGELADAGQQRERAAKAVKRLKIEARNREVMRLNPM